MQVLDISFNNLQELEIFQVLQGDNCSLTSLRINYSKNVSKAEDEFGIVLHLNTTLKEVHLNYSNVLMSGVLKIFDGIKNMSNLVTINISHVMMTSEIAEKLAFLLIHNVSLKELDLSHNNILTFFAIKIFKGLKNTSNLEIINVSHNMIADEAAEELATVLSHNNKLKVLDLSCNYFKSEGFVTIFTGMNKIICLKKLNIGCNEITSEAIAYIGNFLCQNLELKELDLSNSFVSTQVVSRVFKNMKDILMLRKVYLHSNAITDEAADDVAIILSQNNKLEELDISYNNLQTAGAIKIFKAIKHISTLTKLNIAHNMITDEATEFILNVLSVNHKLKELNLSHNNVTILNFTKCNFTDLQVLDLSYTNLQTVVSIEKLDIFTLKKCNISGNFITPNVVDSIAAFLFENDELQELDLSYNDLQEAGIRCILGFINLSNLTKLNLCNTNINNNLSCIANALIHATKLKQLDLSCNKLSSDYIKYLIYNAESMFVNLTELNLSGNEICNRAATALAIVFLHNNCKLKELDLSDTNLHREEIANIFSKLRFPYLTKLSLNHNNINDEAADDIAAFLCNSNKLEELNLDHNYLKSTGAIKICRANPLLELTKFNLSFNSITNEAAYDIAAFLSHSTKLKVLDLSCNDLQESGCRIIFKVIQNLSVLSSLKLSSCNVINKATDELVNVLLHNTLLQELDLSYNAISALDAVKILKGMKSCTHLKSMNISHYSISDEAADKLATVLLHNRLLQEFYLSNNNISTLDAIKIFKGMKNITHLEIIHVSHNNITNQAADELATVLLHNVCLRELDLSYNNLSTSDAVIIFSQMKTFLKLETINISHNPITDEAANSLAIVLSGNINLRTLNISFNYLGNEGCMNILNGMKTNIYLKNLNISRNKITHEAANSITTFMSQNTNLEVLDISYNELHTPGAIKIFQSIKNSSNLTKLNITHNMITNEATEHIINLLCNNNKLKELNLSHNNTLETDLITKLIAAKATEFNDVINEKAVNRISIIITNLRELDLSNINLQTSGVRKAFKGLNNITTLTKFNVSKNYINAQAAGDLGEFLSKNMKLLELDISHNDLQQSGISIILGLIAISNLTKLNISTNNAYLGATAEVLSCATNLVELDLSYNKFNDTVDATMFFNKLKNVFTNLIKLDMSNICHEISNKAARVLAHVLSLNNQIKELYLSDNNLYSEAISKIFSKFNSLSLNKLDISHNNITDQAGEYIATFLSRNAKLEELNLSHTNLLSAGIIKICKCNLSSLTAFDISHNSITTEAADDIADFLSRNAKLQELNLSHNNLQSAGAIKICRTNLSKLTTINISHNGITVVAADDISKFLSHNSKL